MDILVADMAAPKSENVAYRSYGESQNIMVCVKNGH